MTSCTGTLAFTNREISDMSLVACIVVPRLFQQGGNRGAQVYRPKAGGVDAANRDQRFTEQALTTKCALCESDRGASDVIDTGLYGELVIQPCGLPVLYFNAFHDE